MSCVTQIWEGCFANGASENESQRASQNEVDRQAQFRGLRSRHGQSKISAWSNSASFRCFSFCNGIGRRAVGLGTDSLGIDIIITFFLFEKRSNLSIHNFFNILFARFFLIVDRRRQQGFQYGSLNQVGDVTRMKVSSESKEKTGLL